MIRPSQPGLSTPQRRDGHLWKKLASGQLCARLLCTRQGLFFNLSYVKSHWSSLNYFSFIWKLLQRLCQRRIEIRSTTLSLTTGNGFCWGCAREMDGCTECTADEQTHSRELFAQASLHDSVSHACNWLYRFWKHNSKSCSRVSVPSLKWERCELSIHWLPRCDKKAGPCQ